MTAQGAASFDRSRQYELLALASQLKSRGRHAKLVGQIEQAYAVCSAHEDLRNAVESLEALRELTRGPRELDGLEQHLPAAAGALTSHAVILYCRATETSSNHRRRWFNLRMLREDQRSLHAVVKKLRDDAIAHFGTGDAHPEGAVIREALVLHFLGREPRLVFHSAWSLNRARFTDDLLTLAEEARDVARQKAEERLSAVILGIAEAGKGDRSLARMIQQHAFEPGSFFLSPDSQERLWRGFNDGQTSTVTTTVEAPFRHRGR